MKRPGMIGNFQTGSKQHRWVNTGQPEKDYTFPALTFNGWGRFYLCFFDMNLSIGPCSL